MAIVLVNPGVDGLSEAVGVLGEWQYDRGTPVVPAGTMARMSDERGNRLTWIGAGLLRVRWFVRAPI